MQISRSDYMKDSKNLHRSYYAQFVTANTKLFVKNHIGLDLLRTSSCPHFNDVIKHDGPNGWIWDRAPVDVQKMRDCDEIDKNSLPSLASVTCVAKEAARQLLEEEANGPSS